MFIQTVFSILICQSYNQTSIKYDNIDKNKFMLLIITILMLEVLIM